ncbi:MAG: aspartate--tRNA ligase [Planctomycetota bacterium]|nr:aspartate--tRNA ligase [Planctomycetota bacterium]
MAHERAPWQRTHTCGDLNLSNEGEVVVLNGWIENHRDHGQLVFVDLRDRYGVTQVTAHGETEGIVEGALELLQRLGAEDVVSIRGRVRRREGGMSNDARATGEIEVLVQAVTVLNEAEPPPFEVLDEVEANEELRMRYRYLDLRRRPLQEALIKRSRFTTAIRTYLQDNAFVDIETPVLTNSTPEGARDYLVPSRVHPGRFYALPQSPQVLKQICMVAGVDRYYQIARCFRDEDLRADRQPEFTQVDLEMSFVEEDDVLDLVERTVVYAFKEGFDIDLPTPFPRMSFEEAIGRYGSDKPDLRFGMELVDLTEHAKTSAFQVFSGAVEAGGIVKGICVSGAASGYSRKKIDALTKHAQEYGAKGLAWAKVTDQGVEGSIAKFYAGDVGQELIERMGASPGDLLLFGADQAKVVHRALGEVRLKVGDELGLRDPKVFRCCWVLNFPMFEWNGDHQRWQYAHNPFSAPVDWDNTDFEGDPESHRSRAYDFVMNGWELGSGSIRIHRPELQKKVFDFLGISAEEQERNFGYMLEAYKYGGPPHGGIALGLDRMVALALGRQGIRDVIAFPKTTMAVDLMSQAPSQVSPAQLEELKIETTAEPEPPADA